MGTEQQQEFKSEKPCTNPQRKTIPFTDKAIENRKPKKPIYFTNNKQRGNHLFYAIAEIKKICRVGLMFHV